MKWIFIALTVCASSCGDVLCAAGMSEGTEIEDLGPRGIVHVVRYIITRRRIILGGIAYAAAFFSLLGMLSTSPLSVAIPATALSFVLDTIAARFLLHEHVPWKRWVGVACVCVGVALAVQPVPLSWPAGTASSAVQAHKDEARHNQARAKGLDERRATAQVLAEP